MHCCFRRLGLEAFGHYSRGRRVDRDWDFWKSKESKNAGAQESKRWLG